MSSVFTAPRATGLFICALLVACSVPAAAQRTPTPAPSASRRAEPLTVRGFVTFGQIVLDAQQSFDAILGRHTGPVFGGGGAIMLPRGLFVSVGASRFRGSGERVFVGPGREVFPLGIPLDITMVPVELTAGWRYRGRTRRGPWPVVPYAGVGYTTTKYEERASFAGAGDDVDEWFDGYHVLGGVEYRARRWLGLGGEVQWTSLADALGTAGVSAAFDEHNLGGFTVRLKVSVGR